MSDYVPTTEEVRIKYVLMSGVGDEGYNEFARWYAEEIRKAKEEAWDEGHFWGRQYRAQALNGDIPTPNPYMEES